MTFDGCRFVKIIHFVTSMGAPTSRGGMTTVWRPRVRIDVPDVGDAENTDTSREESTKKGTKRKIAPRHYGPCEHGVKHARRARCAVLVRTVVGASMQGVRWGINMRARSSAPSVQGVRWVLQSASTVVGALSARSAVGHQSASTVVYALSARSAVGHQYASTVVGALVQGVRWVINMRARSSAL